MRRLLSAAALAAAAVSATPAAHAHCHPRQPWNPRCWTSEADYAACPALAAMAGSYGVVTINSQGDIYVDGEPTWDCPPYDIYG